MSDLDRLISAVEACQGDAVSIFAKRLSIAARDRGEYWPLHDVEKAFRGSLDAAKALHEALLAGPWSCILTVLPRAGAADLHWQGNMEPAFTGISSNPARAWMLAILRAYRAQRDSQP